MQSKTNHSDWVTNSYDLVHFIWKNKWTLVLVSAIAFASAVIISLSITPRFRSNVVLFPAASVSLSKSLVETTSISTDHRDILSFGEEEEAERMLQILHSNQIKDHVMRKFNLMQHYEIDPASAYPYTRLDKKYKANITFRRTEYMSIEIGVLDTDPQMAADIANEIALYIDSAIHTMQHERAMEAFQVVETEYRNLQAEIEVISDSIQKIRQLGILDYESQASSLNNAYADALSEGNTAAAQAVQSRMRLLSAFGGIYVELSRKLETEMERLGLLKSKYTAIKISLEKTIPQIFIVDKAVRSERKALPKRMVIVFISTVSTFIFTLLILLFINQVKAKSE
jgi:uncharacterized protein involved in exopolysaccharide biosynthesis